MNLYPKQALMVGLTVATLCLTLTNSALAHDPAATGNFGHGMLTFYAQAQLDSPANEAAYAQGAQVTVRSNPAAPNAPVHFVKVTGPANEGGISIDYYMYISLDGTQEGKVEVEGAQIGLDANGTWQANSPLSVNRSPANGNHSAGATSIITHSNTTASAIHGHSFTVGL